MHILTFDIEHWYEAWRLRHWGGWQGLSDCDTPLVENLLEVLEETGRRATFFFTGRFAREFPALTRRCSERGHEVASHSDQHTLLTAFSSLAALKEDLARSVDSISQITGCQTQGFRAPKWSLAPGLEIPVLEILRESGLLYDSSFFPMRRYERGRCRTPHKILLPSGGLLYEIPSTALRLGPLVLPCGGAYFRFFPLAVTQLMFARCAGRGQPGVIYAHPFDLNPGAHFVSGGGIFFRLMRTAGVRRAWKKLGRLLESLEFTRADHWLAGHGEGLPTIRLTPPKRQVWPEESYVEA